MIEIEPEYNVRQFIIIHLNYHIFIFFAVVVIRGILSYTYVYICNQTIPKINSSNAIMEG